MSGEGYEECGQPVLTASSLTLFAQAPKLLNDFKLDVHVVGIANSKSMLLSDSRINLQDWQGQFQEQVRLGVSGPQQHGAIPSWRRPNGMC